MSLNKTAYLQFIFIFFLSQSGLCFSDFENKFNESLRLYSQKQYDESCKLLQILINEKKNKPKYIFNYGNCNYMQKKYVEALQAYEQPSLMKSSLKPIALLYKAKTLRAMGRTREASGVLKTINLEKYENIMKLVEQEALEVNDILNQEENAFEFYRTRKWGKSLAVLDQLNEVDISIEGRFLKFLNYYNLERYDQAWKELDNLKRNTHLNKRENEELKKISGDLEDRDISKYTKWLFVDFSTGKNNNIYFEAKNQNAVTSNYVRTFVNVGRQFEQTGVFKPKVGYSLNFLDFSEDKSLRTIENTVNLVLENSTEESNKSISIIGAQQIWGELSVSNRIGFYSVLSKNNKNYDYGIELELYKQKSLNNSFDYLTGDIGSASIFSGLWVHNTYIRLFCLAGVEYIGNIQYTNGNLLPLANNYSGLGINIKWRPIENLFFTTKAYYNKRNFKEVSLPTMKKRTDESTTFSFRTSYQVKSSYSIYGQVESVNNLSSLGEFDVQNKNYQSTSILIGLAMDFLR